MGCACGGARRRAEAAAPVAAYVYDYTAPGATEAVSYVTPVEAKAAVRRNGGGTVRRRAIPKAA